MNYGCAREKASSRSFRKRREQKKKKKKEKNWLSFQLIRAERDVVDAKMSHEAKCRQNRWTTTTSHVRSESARQKKQPDEDEMTSPWTIVSHDTSSRAHHTKTKDRIERKNETGQQIDDPRATWTKQKQQQDPQANKKNNEIACTVHSVQWSKKYQEFHNYLQHKQANLIQSANGFACIVTLRIVIWRKGLSVLSVGVFSIFSNVSSPKMTCPKTVYKPSNDGCLSYVMKNWLWFVFGPAFAIETTPRSLCLSPPISSANGFPQIDFPPVPSLSSPAWIMKPFFFFFVWEKKETKTRRHDRTHQECFCESRSHCRIHWHTEQESFRKPWEPLSRKVSKKAGIGSSNLPWLYSSSFKSPMFVCSVTLIPALRRFGKRTKTKLDKPATMINPSNKQARNTSPNKRKTA